MAASIENGKAGRASWIKTESERFWRKVGYPDHVVQLYEHDREFMDSLVAFAVCGFNDNQSVVIIATGDHISELDDRLRTAGYDLFTLRLRDQYVTLDAERTLYEFIIDKTPDPILFRLMASNVVKRAKRTGRKVRVFAEGVALLWTRGNANGAFCLEELWEEYMHDEGFTLFCAYPKTAFPAGSSDLDRICKGHTHFVTSSADLGTVEYRLTR